MWKIYKTKEWKTLDLKARAYLIPLIEDIRKGSFINCEESNQGKLEFILDNINLEYKKEGKIHYFVAKEKSLLDKVCLFRRKDITQEEEIICHKNMGDFLGYPECCVDEFIQSWIFQQESPRKEWLKKISNSNKYNQLWNYTFHVPCSIKCKKTLKMLKKIKKVLESNDPEATAWLVKHNKRN